MDNQDELLGSSTKAWGLDDVMPDWSDWTSLTNQTTSDLISDAQSATPPVMKVSSPASVPRQDSINETDPWASAVFPSPILSSPLPSIVKGAEPGFTADVVSAPFNNAHGGMPNHSQIPEQTELDTPNDLAHDGVKCTQKAVLNHSPEAGDTESEHSSLVQSNESEDKQATTANVSDSVQDDTTANSIHAETDISIEDETTGDSKAVQLPIETINGDVQVMETQGEFEDNEQSKQTLEGKSEWLTEDTSEENDSKLKQDSNNLIPVSKVEPATANTNQIDTEVTPIQTSKEETLVSQYFPADNQQDDSHHLSNPFAQHFRSSVPDPFSATSFGSDQYGLTHISDNFLVSPFSSEPAAAPEFAASYVPEIFPLPETITSERDNIASFFSDTAVAPPPLLSFGRARKLSNMFTRPSRQFYTPDPHGLPSKSGSASPTSSIHTSASHDDGVKVKWKHTEIQARVLNVVDQWKHTGKSTGRMFDWDNADQGPSGPTYLFDPLAASTAMERVPSTGISKREQPVVQSSTTAEPVAISFGWQDSTSSNAWHDTSATPDSELRDLHSQVQSATPISGAASMTTIDDNIDNWGQSIAGLSQTSSSAAHPKLHVDVSTNLFGEKNSNDIFEMPTESGPGYSTNTTSFSILQPTLAPSSVASPVKPTSFTANDNDDSRFAKSLASPVLLPAPKAQNPITIPPSSPTKSATATLIPSQVSTTPMVPSTSDSPANINIVQDDDDWNVLMGSPATSTPPQLADAVPTTASNDVSHQSGVSGTHKHTHHHQHQKHLSGVIYFPPPKPSSPAASMYVDSSTDTSASSSTTDLSSTLPQHIGRHRKGTMTLSPTAPSTTDAKLRDDEVVKAIMDAIPDIEYLLD
ncbi:hypothetical protein V1512DRAFT_276305 [Lipomyces arxii]|uniref:uncharacterized protein n=1 Tax=Lipomyces arxii TaxID=56418 RepID=UPI0034CDF544